MNKFMGGVAVGTALLNQAMKGSEAPVAPEGTAQEEVDMAYAALMTGPKATPPRWKTIRRIIRQFKMGLPINGKKVREWRDGHFIIRHPTKRRPTVIV